MSFCYSGCYAVQANRKHKGRPGVGNSTSPLLIAHHKAAPQIASFFRNPVFRYPSIPRPKAATG